LLADIRSCFETKSKLYEIHNGQKRIATFRLLDEYLTYDEDSPWAEFRNGQKLTACQLALEEKAVIGPDLRQALDRLSALPTDIRAILTAPKIF
jgi:hypothetical protein